MTLVKSKAKLRQSSQTRKRFAGHHKTASRHYLKTYWPYLPMVLLILGSLVFSNILSTHPSVLGISSNLSSQSFLTDTNQQREANSEQALALNSQLSEAAQNKAEDMIKENFWSHISPSGETPWQYIAATGYNYQMAGENLAYGFSNANEVTAAWMNSPEHRQNILNSNFTEVGFGVASSSDYIGQGPETIVVAEYAEPAPSSTVTNISFNVAPPTGIKSASTVKTFAANKSTLVSRIEVLSGQGTWLIVLMSFITGVLVCYFVFRNFKRFKKLIKKGEKFAASHLLLDVLIVLFICAGYVLTRAGGAIH